MAANTCVLAASAGSPRTKLTRIQEAFTICAARGAPGTRAAAPAPGMRATQRGWAEKETASQPQGARRTAPGGPAPATHARAATAASTAPRARARPAGSRRARRGRSRPPPPLADPPAHRAAAADLAAPGQQASPRLAGLAAPTGISHQTSPRPQDLAAPREIYKILLRMSSSFFSTSPGARSSSSATAFCLAAGMAGNWLQRSPSTVWRTGK